MKLVTFRTPDRATHAGVLRDQRIIVLEGYPTVLELLRDAEGLEKVRRLLDGEGREAAITEPMFVSPEPAYAMMPMAVPGRSAQEYTLMEAELLSPIPEPPSV